MDEAFYGSQLRMKLKNESMNWVELIGPSGIGKTTFLNSLLQKQQKQRNWVTLQEGLAEVMQTGAKTGVRNKLMQVYFSQKIINTDKQAFIYKFVEKIELQKGSAYNPLLEIFFDFIAQQPFSAIQKVAYINWYFHILKEMEFLNRNEYRKLVIMDEGLFNNTPYLKEENCGEIKIFPNGVIFFHLDVETNLKWINERRKKGNLRSIHRNKSTKELKQYVELEHSNFLTKKEFLLNNNVPLFDIHNKKANYEGVLNFLEEISGAP